MRQATALIISISVLLITVIFTLQNAVATEIKLLFWNTEASLSLILFITLAIGILSAIIALTPHLLSLRSTISKQKKTIEKLEKDIQSRKQGIIEKPKV